MPAADVWGVALIAATAVHAGFQLTVTMLVYPALGDVQPESWHQAHTRHSRRIVPLVGVVYVCVLVTVVGSLVVALQPSAVMAAAASGIAVALTGVVAAPIHGRLGRGRDLALFRRLLWADRWRSVFALVALVGAIAGGVS